MTMPTTILLVDNNKENLAKTAAMLPCDYNVLSAKSEAQGLELLLRFRPDVIIVGSACVADPLSWIEKIEHLKIAAQIVAVSHAPDFERAMTWIQGGVFTVLSWPLSEASLMGAVDRVLEQRETLNNLVRLQETAQSRKVDGFFERYADFLQGLLDRLEVTELTRYVAEGLRGLAGAAEVQFTFCEAFGARRFFYGGELRELASPALNRPAARELNLTYKNRILGEMRLLCADGGRLDAQAAQLLDKMAAAVSGALGRALRYQKAVRLASRDALTGLYNRRVFNESLKREFAAAKRHQQALSLIILDLDHFKAVNDNFGHQTGDEVLKSVASVVQHVCRDCDIAARIGGEEFAIILPHTTQEQAAILAERLRANLAMNVDAPALALVRQTISQGVAGLEHFMVHSTEDLVYWADQALYLAKREGRDAVRVASDLPLKPLHKDGQYAFQ